MNRHPEPRRLFPIAFDRRGLLQEFDNMPLALFALTIGVFAIGTTEFVVVGLIPTLASNLRIEQSPW
jgi:hypothetical protein